MPLIVIQKCFELYHARDVRVISFSFVVIFNYIKLIK